MPSAFEMGLHGQAEQGLHALGVSLMAAEMAELQAIRLERNPWWIEGVRRKALPLMLNADPSQTFNLNFQGCAVGERGGGVAITVLKG